MDTIKDDHFKHFDNCPSGEKHIMIYYEEWTGNYWKSYNKCARCGIQIGEDFNFKGCQKSIDKKHNYIYDSFFENGKKIFKKECTNCGEKNTSIKKLN